MIGFHPTHSRSVLQRRHHAAFLGDQRVLQRRRHRSGRCPIPTALIWHADRSQDRSGYRAAVVGGLEGSCPRPPQPGFRAPPHAYQAHRIVMADLNDPLPGSGVTLVEMKAARGFASSTLRTIVDSNPVHHRRHGLELASPRSRRRRSPRADRRWRSGGAFSGAADRLPHEHPRCRPRRRSSRKWRVDLGAPPTWLARSL